MKKAKILLATAAVATAITCAFGVTACNKDNNSGSTGGNDNDSKITAIYELYSANAQAKGETVLTYEQWLQSIKGETGATGATGATGKSAYDIAVENGFEGTVTEWLESLKGEKGDKGEDGEKGDKGDKGDDGQSSVVVEGIYNISDGIVIKYTDGTVKPVGNIDTPNQLLVLGDNYIDIGAEKNSAYRDAPVTVVSFITYTKGTYKFTLYDENISLNEGTPAGSSSALVDIEIQSDNDANYPGAHFGTNPDGSFYNTLTFVKDYSFFLANWGTTATTVRLTIEKVEE